jgi:hypothetical protein
MNDDDDVLTALARELVTQKGIGESAAAVWKSLQRQSTSSAIAAPAMGASTESAIPLPIETTLGRDARNLRERTPRQSAGEQLTFSF